jgi:hypothetical protein
MPVGMQMRCTRARHCGPGGDGAGDPRGNAEAEAWEPDGLTPLLDHNARRGDETTVTWLLR